MATQIKLRRIAMVGFGEAGSILGEELAAAGREVVTYDIFLDTPSTRGPMLEKWRAFADALGEGLSTPQQSITSGKQ